MNKQQMEYCKERVSNIKLKKLKALEKEFLVRPERKLSSQEMRELVMQHCSLPVRDKNSNYIYHMFDFSAFENNDEYKDGYEEARQEILNESQALLDSICLGDTQEALAMLRKFESEDHAEKP